METAQKSTRDGFGDGIWEIAGKIDAIVALTADLKDSVKLTKFAKDYPERFFEVGVAEQNLAGIAAGFALAGKIPFMTSYAAFSPGRNWEQIRDSICYSNLNVKIVSSHSGFSASYDGATHQGTEDIALTRVLPNLTVLSPADYEQTKKAVKTASEVTGPVYIRLSKNETNGFTKEFALGEPEILKQGKDAVIVGTGPILFEALLAAKRLEREGANVKVVNIHTIKPLNKSKLLHEMSGFEKVFTIEEHQIACGLGGMISEILSEDKPTKVIRMGLHDTFGESGSYKDLLKKYKLDAESIYRCLIENN